MLTAIAFALFAAACCVLAFVRHPIWGLFFYMATTFVHPPSRWWNYMLPDLRWAFLSAAVTILAVAWHRGRLRDKPLWMANAPAVLMLMYAGWMILQTPFAIDQSTHIEGTILYVKYLVAFWFIYRLVDSVDGLRELLLAQSLGCAFLGLIAMGTGRSGGRVDGVGGPGMDDSNTLGMVLAVGALSALGLAMSQKGKLRWIALGALALIGEGFVLANSRGAFLGLATGALVLAVCKARSHRRMFWGVAALGLVGFAVVVDKTFIERMLTISDVTEVSEDADMSARSRRVIMEAQLKMAFDHPAGVGFRGTVTLSPQYLDPQWLAKLDENGAQAAGRSSHNTFMTAWVEQGIPGLLLFITMVVWLLAAIARLRSLAVGPKGDPQLLTLGASVLGGLVVVYVAGMATDYLLAEVQFWWFAALVSVFWLAQPRALVSAKAPGAPAVLPANRRQASTGR